MSSLRLEEATNKESWEAFLADCTEKTFLQSWQWGKYHESLNHQIWRFVVSGDSGIFAVALVIRVSARRGTFLFIPHGPVIKESLAFKDKQEILQLIMDACRKLAKDQKAGFIRMAPILLENEENQELVLRAGFRRAPMHASAYEATWKLDIQGDEDMLFSQLRKTTRYLIRKAKENTDVEIEITADPNAIAQYQELNKAVAARQKFVPFSDMEISREFEMFAEDRQVEIIFGKYQGKVVAGAMVIFWSGVAFYHQAGSLGEFSKLSIPYLLQWEAIREAKRKGCITYDFWGYTDPVKYPKHPWAGPTLFKMGFGGYATEYVKTQDAVVSPSYWISYIIELARKFKRGL